MGRGGGGASSSSSGGAASGGGGQQAAARAPDLSKVVEAVKKVAEAAQAAKKAPATKGSTKGITQARRRYTDKRKITLAALRSLKSKRIREFNNKTKKLPKTERDKQRREFKKYESDDLINIGNDIVANEFVERAKLIKKANIVLFSGDQALITKKLDFI